MAPIARDRRGAGLAGRRRLYVCCHTPTDLPVPATFSLTQLTAVLEEQRGGRPVYVAAMRHGPQWARAWVAGDDADWIVYRHSAARNQRVWFTVHQAAHMFLGHQGVSVDGEMFGELLFPNLNRALGHTHGTPDDLACGLASPEEERRAQTAATELMAAASQARSCSVRNSMIAW